MIQSAQSVFPPELCIWLTKHAKGSYLKSLYIEQITWRDEWLLVIESFKSLDEITTDDWVSLYPDPAMKPHTPYILRTIYERKAGLKKQARCHKLLLLKNLKTAVLPTVSRNNTKLRDQIIGGFEVNDPDPALTMSDAEFTGINLFILF